MRVTADTKIEGQSIAKDADFLGTDELTGVKVRRDYSEIDITVDSLSLQARVVHLDLETAKALAEDILAKVYEGGL